MSILATHIKKRLLLGLERTAVQTPSRWSTTYRVLSEPFPGPWSFKYHPWLRVMHDAKEQRIVGQKSAQAGYTETLLNRAFYALDIEKRSVLYVLPNLRPDAYDKIVLSNSDIRLIPIELLETPVKLVVQ